MTTSGHRADTAMVPRLIEVWAPSCSSCRAMRPDLEAVSAEFEGRVAVEYLDASSDPGRAAALGVASTPTMIVLDGDVERSRVVGRRSRDELFTLFSSIAGGGTVRNGPARADVAIRLVAGFALAGIGLVSGPTWVLVGVGIVIVSIGLLPLLRSHR